MKDVQKLRYGYRGDWTHILRPLLMADGREVTRRKAASDIIAQQILGPHQSGLSKNGTLRMRQVPALGVGAVPVV